MLLLGIVVLVLNYCWETLLYEQNSSIRYGEDTQCY